MKKLFAFVLMAGLLAACTSTTEPDTDAAEAKAAAKAKAEENVALAEKYLAAFESGDFESWREICAEDFVTYGPGLNDEGNLDEYIESMMGFSEATDSAKLHTIAILPHTVEEGELAGDYVFWWGSNSAYFIEAGKSAKLSIHTVFKIEEGKIKWESDYWDTGDLKSQLSDEKEKEVEGEAT